MKISIFSASLSACALLAGATLSGCGPAGISTVQYLIKAIGRRGQKPFVDTEYVKNLPQTGGGIGLFVAQPVAGGHDADLTHFGAGCERWLQLYAAGQPALTATPSWWNVNDARIGLGQCDFTAGPKTAPAWSKALGGVDVAVGTLTGSGDNLDLSYQLYGADGKPWDSPVEASGTADFIAAHLPEIALDLDSIEAVKSATMPAATGLSAADLGVLGAYPWFYHYGAVVPDALSSQVDQLGQHNALAALLKIENGRGHTIGDWKPAFDTALEGAPGNTIVCAAIAATETKLLTSYGTIFRTLAAKNPSNYLLFDSRYWCDKVANNAAQEQFDAEQAVDCAPDNAEAWYNLGRALLDQSEAIRAGRKNQNLDESSRLGIEKQHARAEAVFMECVHRDPKYPAWSELSETAAIHHDAATAESALWQEIQVNPYDWTAYRWGFHWLSPRWNNRPAELLHLTQIAADNSAHVWISGKDLKTALTSINRADLLPELLSEIEANDPQNGSAWTESGNLALTLPKKDIPTARADFEHALAADPQYCYAYGGLGMIILVNDKNPAKAEPLFRKAIALYPKEASFHYGLSLCLAKEGRMAESRQESAIEKEILPG